MKCFIFAIALMTSFCMSSLNAKESVWNKKTHLKPVLRVFAELVPYIAAITCYYQEAEGTLHSIAYLACCGKVTFDAHRLMNAIAYRIESDHLW